MPLRIPYESEGFPAARGLSSWGELTTSWNELLWAAVTVGRPNRQYVFQHGQSSIYEALFRWSLVRMALEQRGAAGFRLYRTAAARSLDPSEKGAVNYFLGLSICKLFAARLLDTPWVLHLDIFGQQLNVRAALNSRSRPDLIGQDSTLEWHAFECKGRASPPNADAKAKAKAQAQRVVSVSGSTCQLHVGALTFFQRDVINFYWRDPEPSPLKPIIVDATPDVWRWYYEPVNSALSREREHQLEQSVLEIHVEQADVTLRVHHLIADLIRRERWGEAREMAGKLREAFSSLGLHPDGLAVRAGESWTQRFAQEA